MLGKKVRMVSIVDKYSGAQKKNNAWVKYLSFGASVVVALCAMWYMRTYTSKHQAQELALYTARDIPAYAMITKSDLVWHYVPVGSIEADSAVNPGQVLGKYTRTELYADEQINLNRISSSPSSLGDRELISVPTNLSVSVGGTVRPGDHVDVYIPGSGNIPSALIAQDAVIVSVENAQGQAIGGGSNSAQLFTNSTPSNIPGIVILAVRPQDVANTVDASAGKGAVLVKIMTDNVDISAASVTQPLMQPETAVIQPDNNTKGKK